MDTDGYAATACRGYFFAHVFTCVGAGLLGLRWDLQSTMVKLFLLYAHLLATCMAIGTIASADAKLLAKVFGYRVVFHPPSLLERRVISGCLMVLFVTGAGLIFLGLADNPDYLMNGKLQAKLMLVLALLLNAVVLHGVIFPALKKRRPVSQWRASQLREVSLSVGLSTSAWLFTAFLGIARDWNFNKGWHEILMLALVFWLLAALAVRAGLAVARLERTPGQAGWMHRFKDRLAQGLPVSAV